VTAGPLHPTAPTMGGRGPLATSELTCTERPPETPTMRHRNPLLAAALLTLVASLNQPIAEGQSSTWTVEVIPGFTSTISQLAVAHDGERLGLAYQYSGGTVGFSVRSADGTWTKKTDDITAAGALTLARPSLVFNGGTSWLLAVTDSASPFTFKVYKTTDDGATWSVTLTDTQNTSALTGGIDLTGGFGTVYALFSDSSNQLIGRLSTDSGATWSASKRLDDPQGAPTGTGTSCCYVGSLATFIHDGQIEALFEAGDRGTSSSTNPKVFDVTSGDGLTWTVPFGTGSTCYVNNGASKCYVATGTGIGSVNIAGAGNPIHAWLRSGNYEEITTHTLPLAGVTSGTPTFNAIASCAGTRSIGAHAAVAGSAANIYIAAQTCTATPTGLTVRLRTSPIGTWADTYVNAAITTSIDLVADMTATKAYVFYTDSAVGDRVELIWANNASLTPIPSANPSITVAVTNATALSVDPSGNTVITRQGDATLGGRYVRTYSGGTLAQTGSTDTHCSSIGGVFATDTHTLYLQCDPDDGQTVVSYNIRGASLGDPPQPAICHDTGFCIKDIPDASVLLQGALAGNHDHDVHIAGFQDFPITYLNNQNGILDDDAVWMAFGFTTTAGDLGVVSYVMNNNGVDRSDIATAQVGGGQAPDQLCLVRDATGATAGLTFIYASSSASNVRGYRVDWTHRDVGLSDHHLIPALVNVFPGTTTTAAARGIACGDGKFAILNTDKVTVWRRGATAPYITKTGLGAVPELAGIAMSSDGGWVDYIVAGNHNFLNTTTGNVTLSFPYQSSTDFKGVALHGHACAVWDLTRGNLERYDLVGTVCIHDDAFSPPVSGTGGDTVDLNHDGIPDSQQERTFVKATSDSGKNAFYWLIGCTLAGVLAGWTLSGGRIQNRRTGLPDITPGNPFMMATFGYVGMWGGVIWKATDWWWLPIVIAIGGAAFLVFGNKHRSGT
jgi:hypothetical protein